MRIDKVFVDVHGPIRGEGRTCVCVCVWGGGGGVLDELEE